jgi:cyclohexa-1,5-dienecarbonyl-CoA hydratase
MNKLAPFSYSRLSLHFAPNVATVTLKNPPLNVIDIPMMEELAHAFSEIEARPHTWIIVIKGDGKAFSAGVDVAAHTPDKVTTMLNRFHALIYFLIRSDKISIAAVNGPCLGGGAELAMICDMAYTTQDAQWGFPEIKLGCYPPVACTALAALVGQKQAADLILTGRSISGTEAAATGLANRAVPADELSSAVEACVDRLKKLSPAALAITKRASYAWDSMHFDKGLARAEKIYLDELINMHDAQEGLAAFLEKRPPVWKGK